MADTGGPAIDMDGALTVEDMARLLRLSPRLIRSLVKAERFPIAPMRGVSRRVRFWGPTVRQWCEQRAYGVPADDVEPAPATEKASRP
jgi:hypothetical protein